VRVESAHEQLRLVERYFEELRLRAAA